MQLNQRVVRVDYDPAAALVTLTTSSNETYTAKRVVLTVSLGVLQARAISFSPPLPDTKLAAIDRLGMGLMNKIFLQWDKSSYPFSTRYDFYYWVGQKKYCEWLNLENAFPGTYAMLAFNEGAEALALEARTDEEVVDEIMAMIRLWYPLAKYPSAYRLIVLCLVS